MKGYDGSLKNQVLVLYRSGKSINKVSKETGVHRSSVYRWLRKAGITRSLSEAQKGRIISQKQREKISLALKGRFLGEERWNFKCLKGGYDVASPEFAYILGVLFGDGFICKSSVNHVVGLQSIDREFIDEFAQCLYAQFGHEPAIYECESKPIQIRKTEKTYMRSKSFNLRFHSLAARKFLENTKNWDYVSGLSQEHKKHFIRGLWDSEGTIGVKHKKFFQIKFCTKDRDLAEKYQLLLKEVLGIDAHINPAKSGMYYVNFARLADVVKFYEAVQPTIVRKRVILDSAVARANVLNQR